MLIPFFRTLILYGAIILAVRMMGKRQVGEMQPTELVVTILVSAVASVPMQELDIPLSHGLVPVVTLIAAEVLLSVAELKWPALSRLLSGKPVPVIQNGRADRKALRSLRMSTDDLLEELRLAGVFDPRAVDFAQVETNGKLSVLEREEGPGPFWAVISDGRLQREGLAGSGRSRRWVEEALAQRGLRTEEVFLFCADKKGNMLIWKKEDC